MMSSVLITLLLVLFHVLNNAVASSTSASSFPVGDIRNCPTTQVINDSKSLMRMDVLPGLGFDALRSLDIGKVYNYDYSTCQISADGLYLLPDNIRLIPILNSQVDFTAEVYEHAEDWSSETSHSLNVHAKVSYYDINAKFSMDYQKTKTKMANEKSRATRAGLHYHLYSVEINPDSQLNPLFKSRILDIAANIQRNNTKIAHYLSEKLVADYGTHVITGIDAGARLSQTTFFTSTSETLTESARLNISASASANFFSLFSISTRYTFTHNTDQGSTTHTQKQSSYTTTHGGPMYLLGDNFTYADWEKEVPNHLVAIDRRGEPIYTVLTPATVPELSAFKLARVASYVDKAISRYYTINTHSGCTDFNSSNFDFHANVDDGSCKLKINKTVTNQMFGGFYQTCEGDADLCSSKKANQKNPLTNDYSCSDEYKKILLHSGSLSFSKPVSYKHCYWRHAIHHCHTYYRLDVHSATYKLYWCMPISNDSDDGLRFGGFYSSTQTNILTGKKSCPNFYSSASFALGDDIKICVTASKQPTNSLDFGGFYSCTAGNPLADSENSMACPFHYIHAMVVVDEDCTINVCTNVPPSLVNVYKIYKPRPPILPPFQRSFKIFDHEVENNPGKDHDDDIDINDYEFVGIIVGVVVGTVIFIVFIWVVIYRVRKYSKKKRNSGLSVQAD